MMSATPQVALSICICTRNRPDDLEIALASIGRSGLPVFQIVVSDDSTDDRTKLLMRERYTHVDFIEGPRRGLCANRNTALTAVRGTHVLFIDDDAALGPDFLANIDETLLSVDPAVRSRTIVSGLERLRGNLIFPSDQTFLGYQRRTYRSGDRINTVVINAAVFPIGLFELIGFDSNLMYGSDEVDLTTRAIARGFQIVLCPAAVNDHYSSDVNREQYQKHINASRLYVTLKRYYFTQHAYARALGFVLVAPVHLTASLVKRRGPSGFRAALESIAFCVSYVEKYLRSRPDTAALGARRTDGYAATGATKAV